MRRTLIVVLVRWKKAQSYPTLFPRYARVRGRVENRGSCVREHRCIKAHAQVHVNIRSHTVTYSHIQTHVRTQPHTQLKSMHIESCNGLDDFSLLLGLPRHGHESGKVIFEFGHTQVYRRTLSSRRTPLVCLARLKLYRNAISI